MNTKRLVVSVLTGSVLLLGSLGISLAEARSIPSTVVTPPKPIIRSGPVIKPPSPANFATVRGIPAGLGKGGEVIRKPLSPKILPVKNVPKPKPLPGGKKK